MQSPSTLFSYVCGECGLSGPLSLDGAEARCGAGHKVGGLDGEVLIFFEGENEQTGFHDDLYGKALDAAVGDGGADFSIYERYRTNAVDIASKGGVDLDVGLRDKTVLEIACGTGWLTAGLILEGVASDSRFHCFDISRYGVKLLSEFAKTAPLNGNRIEVSTQDANDMRLADESFDVILGNSVIHHFDDYQTHLRACHRLLKPGGHAHYGEPFAIGHALPAAFLKMAADRLGKSNPRVDVYYRNIGRRIYDRDDKPFMKDLMDKHLFFQDELIRFGLGLGFSDVKLTPRRGYASHTDGRVVRVMAKKRGIIDDEIIEEAVRDYDVLFQMFGEDCYERVFPNFLDLVLVK